MPWRTWDKQKVHHAYWHPVFSSLSSSCLSTHDWEYIQTSQGLLQSGKNTQKCIPLWWEGSETVVQSLGTRKINTAGTLQNVIKYPGCAHLNHFLLVKRYWKHFKKTSSTGMCNFMCADTIVSNYDAIQCSICTLNYNFCSFHYSNSFNSCHRKRYR